jgi:hypothetical protein
MNPYQMLIPQLLAALVIVVIARWAVRRTRQEKETDKEYIAKQQMELQRYISQVKEAAAHPSEPACKFITEWQRTAALQITLKLTDADAVVDVGQIAQDSAQLLAGVSRYEEAIGGRGLILTKARAEQGSVVLILTPKDTTGATDRVKRVVEALNAAFDATDSPSGTAAIPDLGRLPADISGAHAVALAA